MCLRACVIEHALEGMRARESQRLWSGGSALCFLGTWSLVAFIYSAMLRSQEAQRPSCLCLPSSGIPGWHHRTRLFHMVLGIRTWGPRICKASSVETEHPPQGPHKHTAFQEILDGLGFFLVGFFFFLFEKFQAFQ